LQLCKGAEHEPAEQVPASVSENAPVMQTCDEQEVPFGYFWQPPAPSHLPFVPQFAARLSTQTPFGSTVPAPSGEHVPAFRPTLQAWHDPQLGLPQQTLSTQWLERHWLPAVQDVPGAPLGAQAPPAPVQ
jgi:hypothetical protein